MENSEKCYPLDTDANGVLYDECKKGCPNDSEKLNLCYPFEKDDGYYLPCKIGCPNCKHCTDVFWDYTNGIYMTFCDIEEEAPFCDKYENDGTKGIKLEEFKKFTEEN